MQVCRHAHIEQINLFSLIGFGYALIQRQTPLLRVLSVALASADNRDDLRVFDVLVIHVVARSHSARANQRNSHLVSPLQFKAVRRQISRTVCHGLD